MAEHKPPCGELKAFAQELEDLKHEYYEARKEERKTSIRVWDAINKLSNGINRRLPLWATFLIGGLMSLCTGLIVYAVAMGR